MKECAGRPTEWVVMFSNFAVLLQTFQSYYGTEGLFRILVLRPKKNIRVLQVSRPYLGFCPDPKHFIVNCEQNVVKFAGKWGGKVM